MKIHPDILGNALRGREFDLGTIARIGNTISLVTCFSAGGTHEIMGVPMQFSKDGRKFDRRQFMKAIYSYKFSTDQIGVEATTIFLDFDHRMP